MFSSDCFWVGGWQQILPPVSVSAGILARDLPTPQQYQQLNFVMALPRIATARSIVLAYPLIP